MMDPETNKPLEADPVQEEQTDPENVSEPAG